ncbi:tripartite tricarboxylate transporter substrate binding protein [Piscinibacter sakaiensis]|uniref:Putative exported protein n=1 Tax=Piscinibacter sakaiensis TaxID=1547922 RepID=A0A0K8NVA7_PISS1|nr:tripartite tricarboxylate transporter substrate binding protein [Piscinibacter sakaiensis]GAP34313.1 putative exported protein [Piscinibacter sakaiensis]
MATRRTFLGTAASLATVPLLPVAAQAASDYPSKPIRMVVPYAGGGSADVLGRVLAEAMSRSLRQSVVVDLKPGAGGNLGAELVAKSAPGDGYSLLFASVSLSTAVSFTKLSFDPRKDLVPVAGVGTLPSLLLVGARSPYQSVADIVKAAGRGQPIDFASAGYTTGSHLFGELLKMEAGIEANHVPYRGSGAAYPDLLAGRIAMMFDVAGSAVPQVQAGTVRALAITSSRRSKSLPDVPTLAELGYKGFDVGTWFGFFVPAGTPAEATTRLEAAVLQSLSAPEVVTRLASVMADPIPGPGRDFGRWYLEDVERWAKLARERKIVVGDK